MYMGGRGGHPQLTHSAQAVKNWSVSAGLDILPVRLSHCQSIMAVVHFKTSDGDIAVPSDWVSLAPMEGEPHVLLERFIRFQSGSTLRFAVTKAFFELLSVLMNPYARDFFPRLNGLRSVRVPEFFEFARFVGNHRVIATLAKCVSFRHTVLLNAINDVGPRSDPAWENMHIDPPAFGAIPIDSPDWLMLKVHTDMLVAIDSQMDTEHFIELAVSHISDTVLAITDRVTFIREIAGEVLVNINPEMYHECMDAFLAHASTVLDNMNPHNAVDGDFLEGAWVLQHIFEPIMHKIDLSITGKWIADAESDDDAAESDSESDDDEMADL